MNTELNQIEKFIEEIENCYSKAGAALSAFLLTFALADCLSVLYSGKTSGDKTFELFLGSFQETKQYCGKDLYGTVRSRLLHNLSIGDFLLTHGNSVVHLTSPQKKVVLNFEDFFRDIKTVAKAILFKVKNPQTEEDFTIKNNVEARIKKTGIIQTQTVSIPAAFEPAFFAASDFQTEDIIFSASGTVRGT